jgi:predicted ester cyclase
MASNNVEMLRSAHESWNKRDFASVVKNAAEKLTYTDNARAVTFNSRDKFREWTEEWAKAFPNGLITNAEYIDAGDIVIARFTVVGTNDGPLGSMKPTGRKMSLPFCEICHFDKQGRTVSGGCYYDQYTLMTQLGHIPLAAAA